MRKPVVILDPGHGGLKSFFYDLDNGVKLPYTWDDVARLEPGEKRYVSDEALQRWRSGELATEPRFYFERHGRRITFGDPGCVSPLDPRVCEKDLVLDVARSLHRELCSHLLVKPTRERDGYVSTGSRIHIVERLVEKYGGEAVLLSLHVEASGETSLRGFRIRRRPGRDLRLAKLVEASLIEHLDGADDPGLCREIFEDEDPLLAHTEIPGLVVELGFLSNLEDARRLLDRHERQELARALALPLRQLLLRSQSPRQAARGVGVIHPGASVGFVEAGL